MSNRAFFLLISGLVSLSLLWLLEKYLDFRHVPEAAKKLDERSTAVGANTVLFLFWAAASAFRALKEAAIVPRVVFALGAMVSFGTFWESDGRYRKIGRAK
jgi:hypothetical protein